MCYISMIVFNTLITYANTEYNYGLNQNKLPRANAKIFVSSAITPHEQRVKLVET